MPNIAIGKSSSIIGSLTTLSSSKHAAEMFSLLKTKFILLVTIPSIKEEIFCKSILFSSSFKAISMLLPIYSLKLKSFSSNLFSKFVSTSVTVFVSAISKFSELTNSSLLFVILISSFSSAVKTFESKILSATSCKTL